jgi:PAS domain S-box-containing protein
MAESIAYDALLHGIVESSEDAIIGESVDGTIILWNPAAERIFGYTAAEAIGQPMDLIVPPEKKEESQQAASLTRLGQRLDHYETVRTAKDGRRVEVSLSASPIQDATGTIAGVSHIFREVGERKRLEREAFHLAALVQSSEDAIASKNLEGIVLSWNPAAEQMFGYAASEIVGRSIRVIIPEDRLAEEDEVLRRIKSGGRIDHFETMRRRKDGTMIPISLTVSPIYDQAGRIIGASKIARDLTPLRTYATTLEETVKQSEATARGERVALARERDALRTAQEALHLKDEFLATLSHELRTPLSAISGWLQLMKMRPDQDRMTRGLSAIERNTNLLVRLIDDLVDVSRIMSGTLTLQVQSIDLRKVVDAAVDSVRPDIQAKRLHLEIASPSNIGWVEADPDRMQQVVWNLLSNAVKFTPEEGRITVTIARVGSTIELTVADTGPGISQEFLPRAFDRFSQQDGGKNRQHGGMGLGLAIVRHLTEMHGGTVSVTSVEGEGARFSVCLPVAKTGVTRPGKTTFDRPYAAALTGVHVLVIDDHADARDVACRMLEDQGASVAMATSAAEGYDALTTRPPADALICDIGMPDEDGLTLIARIRTHADPAVATIPAVVVTAYVREYDRLRALGAGFDAYLPKPFSGIDLVTIVRQLVDARLTRKNRARHL